MEDVWVFRGSNCGSDHFLVRSKIFLPWIYSMNSSTEVNQKLQRTREEDVFNVELLKDDSILYYTQEQKRMH
jgi:hypothetical protein